MKIPVLFFIGLSFNLFAQSFKPDMTGRVNSEAFTAFCKKRTYMLVGTFDSLPLPAKGMAAQVVKNNSWIYIDLNGKEFRDHDALAKHYGFYTAPIRDYIDEMPRDYNERIPMPVDVSVKQPFTGAFASGGKYGYKYRDRIIIKAVYDQVEPLYNIENFLFIRVSDNGLYGMCDYEGKLVIPVIYNQLDALPFPSAQCFFVAEKKGKQGFLPAREKSPFLLNTTG